MQIADFTFETRTLWTMEMALSRLEKTSKNLMLISTDETIEQFVPNPKRLHSKRFISDFFYRDVIYDFIPSRLFLALTYLAQQPCSWLSFTKSLLERFYQMRKL
jgi:hypothetical protein